MFEMFWTIVYCLAGYFWCSIPTAPLLFILFLSFYGVEPAREQMIRQAERWEYKAKVYAQSMNIAEYNRYAYWASQIREDIPKVNYFNHIGYLKKYGLAN